MTFWEPKTANSGRIEELVIGATEEARENARFIGSSPKHKPLRAGALSAATDFFFYEFWECEQGLHIRRELEEDEMKVELGYVAQWYAGLDYPKPGAGWAPLTMLANHISIADFNSDAHAQAATIKHDMMDWFAAGKGVRIRVMNAQGLANYWMNLWQSDVEIARKISEHHVGNKKYLEAVSGDAEKREREYIGDFVPKKPSNPDFEMPLRSGVSVPMASLPYGKYWVLKKTGRKIAPYYWKGDTTQWEQFARAGLFIDKAAAELLSN